MLVAQVMRDRLDRIRTYLSSEAEDLGLSQEEVQIKALGKDARSQSQLQAPPP